MARPFARTWQLAALGGAAFVLLVSASGVASAKDPSASELALAKDMLREGIADEKAGKCDDAIDVLKQVLAINETAEALFHLGSCQASRDLKEGLATLDKAADLAAQEGNKSVTQAITAKKAELQDRMPTVSFKLPAGAKDVTVKVDGNDVTVARLTKPFTLAPGEHTLDATASRSKPLSLKFTLAEKDAKTLDLDFVPEEDSAPPPPPPPPPRSVPLVTWVAGSASVALAVGGAIAFVAAGSAASDGQATCSRLVKCDPSDIDSVHQLDTAALALWIGAGVGAGVAVTFFVLNKPAAPPARSSLASPRGGLANAPRPPSSRVMVGPASIRFATEF